MISTMENKLSASFPHPIPLEYKLQKDKKLFLFCLLIALRTRYGTVGIKNIFPKWMNEYIAFWSEN